MVCELVYNKQAIWKVGGLAFSWTLGTLSRPLQLRSGPLQELSWPLQARLPPLKARTRPLQAHSRPLQALPRPLQASSQALHALSRHLQALTPFYLSSTLYTKIIVCFFSFLENKITLTVNL